MADTNIAWKIQMMAQKDITWKIQMMAQKDITWKIQMMLLKSRWCSSKEKQQKIKKQKQKNRVPQNMEENYRGTHIWRGVEENAKQFIRMRKQHVLPMNHASESSSNQSSSWSEQSSGAHHSYLPCSVGVGALPCPSHCLQVFNIFFVRIVLNLQIRSAGPSAGHN